MQRIGFAFGDRPPPQDCVRLGRLAEDLGYESVWVTEPRMARDAISVLGALAATTTRIKLGAGAINDWTRGPGLAGVTFATLNAMAPGRVMMGLCAYWDPLAWNQGILRRKHVTAMREYVEVVRRLFRLERVTFEGEVVQVRDLELDLAHADELGYGDGRDRAPLDIPIYLGPTRNRMLELSGEVADGVLLNGPFSCDYVRHAVKRIEAGAERAGRDFTRIDTPKLVYVSVDRGDPGAWSAVKRKITRYLGQQEHVREFSGLDPEEASRIMEAMGGWPPRPGGVNAAMALVPDAVARSLVAFGPPEECRRRIQEFVEAGVSCPVLITEQDVEETMRLFAPGTW